ncbi:MAG: ribonuclease HI family protein [Methanomicrobiales archaeon]|nr:ribonuclease HI family protein [Methanomicrobiales archaeon]
MRTEQEILEIYTDGASRGNPGDAAWAYIFCRDGKIVGSDGGFLGRTTNNQAEYHAVIHALAAAHKAGCSSFTLYSDSELVIRQIRGEYAVRSPALAPLMARVRELQQRFHAGRFTAVPRTHPLIAAADRLCNEILDAHARSEREDRIPPSRQKE